MTSEFGESPVDFENAGSQLVSHFRSYMVGVHTHSEPSARRRGDGSFNGKYKPDLDLIPP